MMTMIWMKKASIFVMSLTLQHITSVAMECKVVKQDEYEATADDAPLPLLDTVLFINKNLSFPLK
jgi:hypothetical protein